MTPPLHSSHSEILGGVVLLIAAIAALFFVNLGGAEVYVHSLEYQIVLGIRPFVLEKTAHHWINDGLMVLFFLLVGIEIHREIRTGALRTPQQALLPILAALGGFVTPAVMFVLIAGSDPLFVKGWSIPTATDIAFAVALVTVLKERVPASLRVFLLALAVADDLLAIIVIAVFYTADVIWMNLFLVLAACLLLVAKRRLGIQKLWVYLVAGVFVWLCVLKSGVHATVAGVIIGLLLPIEGVDDREAPAVIVEHLLQPWVRWLVLPLFAFANVGVDLTALSLERALSLLTLGIALSLFLGKQLGVFGTVWVLHKARIPKPDASTWRQVYGVACLCGIGFTMSLFVGALALPPHFQPEVRLGVLFGSVLSAIAGIIVLLSNKNRA